MPKRPKPKVHNNTPVANDVVKSKKAAKHQVQLDAAAFNRQPRNSFSTPWCEAKARRRAKRFAAGYPQRWAKSNAVKPSVANTITGIEDSKTRKMLGYSR